ncbi:hypothetical protein ACFSQQ_14725 [Mesorhizobium kowhaii]|uniref:hypothetical protein n=1 Tax=Mesorhizobium kowhaii TaxID=1300272 RepID=UPI0035EAC421
MPNTHVPAAGEAMPAAEEMKIITGRFSRRLILAGIASLPALGAATAAVARPEAVSPHPDAELFQLEREIDALKDRMDKLEKSQRRLCRKAEKAAGQQPLRPSDWEKQRPSLPEDLKAMRTKAQDHVTFGDVLRGAEWEPPAVRAWYAAIASERAAIKAAWDQFSGRLDEQHRLLGYDAKEAEFDAVCSEQWDIGRRIFATPAHTVEGMAVKLRAGESLGLDTEACNDTITSISADIKRLVGGAV